MSSYTQRLTDIHDILKTTTYKASTVGLKTRGQDQVLSQIVSEINRMAGYINCLPNHYKKTMEAITTVPVTTARIGSQDLVHSLIIVHFTELKDFIHSIVDEMDKMSLELVAIETELFKVTSILNIPARERGSTEFLSQGADPIDHKANVLAELARLGLDQENSPTES
jgi:hypothetical protein